MAATTLCHYDDLRRLCRVEYSSGAVLVFTYDDAGNRETETVVIADSDGDGLPDAMENASASCTDPLDADTDDDGIPDGSEDANLDGVTQANETNPCDPDTDNDGIQDGTEQGLTQGDLPPDTDLAVFIPDADPDAVTDPLDADTDNDGFGDGREDRNRNGAVDPNESDPKDPESVPGSVAMPWIHLLLSE
jgi:hypothetical protein